MDFFLTANVFLLWIVALTAAFFALRTHYKLAQILNGGAATRSKAGTPIPKFRAVTLDDRPIDHEDFASDKSLLVFLSTECEVCLAALPNYLATAKELRLESKEFALVSVSDLAETRAAFHTHQLDSRVIVAPSDTNPMSKDFGILGTPAFVYCERGHIALSGYPSSKDRHWVEALDRLDRSSTSSPVHAPT